MSRPRKPTKNNAARVQSLKRRGRPRGVPNQKPALIPSLRPGQLLQVSTAARLLDCTKKRVYQFRQAGLLDAVALSVRGMRITSDSLILLINNRRLDSKLPTSAQVA